MLRSGTPFSMEARSEVKEAIVEVRRLVDVLRPPAIDEVGLLAAIRQRALGLSEAMVFEVRGPTAMPDLPAAVETAAFRIAAEAMTNVTRHAVLPHRPSPGHLAEAGERA